MIDLPPPTLWHRRAVMMAMASLAVAPSFPPDAQARADNDPFALGVASGDPSGDGFVLWTRLIGPALLPLDAASVAVRHEIAADPGFRTVLRRGVTPARREGAHSVHVEVVGLPPGRRYWYRFHALGATSAVGCAVTVPPTSDRLRLAVSSCQHWEQARFGAYRDMIAQQPDIILQLGDYIYEQSYPDQPKVRSFGAPEPLDLAGYRQRHALYKTDPDLQAAHRACPWVVTWDDHEVLNDYAGLANRTGEPAAIFAARRAAAYQAYFEHMPIRPSLWRGLSEPRLYRAVDWGDLASLAILDTRQHRSAPPCADPGIARNVRLDGCADAAAPSATIMGAAQERWLDARLASERRPWTLIGQQVFFAPLYLDSAARSTFSDQWDGYAANRNRLLRGLSRMNTPGPVILSGDVHSFWVNDLNDSDGRPVAGEIVTSALAAASPPAGRFGDVLANNGHIRFSDVERAGYVLIDVGRTRLTANLRAITNRQQVDSPVTSIAAFAMERGSRRLVRA
ncbi:alkaline phosphatase D family protein [uncultured Sphingomonas sp.]|uniref:alkaline phosphatase D family protein n=1 Tax=uncultured Sphingomonas sp. TaxID=158754 RepID=UPI0025ED08AD|nr:alkaline phosphatase D family protein [uncultured Sphingomonas sp.]